MLRVATLSALAVAAAKEHLCVPWTRAQRSALERSNAFLPEPSSFTTEAPRDADADALHALLRSLGEACADPFLPVGGTNALGSHLNALVLPLSAGEASACGGAAAPECGDYDAIEALGEADIPRVAVRRGSRRLRRDAQGRERERSDTCAVPTLRASAMKRDRAPAPRGVEDRGDFWLAMRARAGPRRGERSGRAATPRAPAGYGVRSVFVATDDPSVVAEARAAGAAAGLPVLDGTAARARRSFDASAAASSVLDDVAILARCDAFVGKFTSNVDRLAYALLAARSRCRIQIFNPTSM
ncbi:hypothetical protein JL722_14693 [Aureococcus anophagefferens]|nr:hypothetical protein JL722_14693 [Aureococcus anophagefferens]